MTAPILIAPSKEHPLVHWKTWVVPATMLRDFIHQYKHIWQFRYSPPLQETTTHGAILPNERFGWRTHLSLEIAMTTGQSVEAAQRHLYRCLTNESHVITIDFAEAVVMSVDLDIDRDTEIPVLPGNLRNAQELLEVRDEKFWERPEEERVYLQRVVMRLCEQIIDNPSQMVEFQDDAPFDCLRPPR
jgi:hypothetical protein